GVSMAEPGTTDRPAAPAAPASQSGADKAAILLLTLGSEVATSIFKHLGESEVRQLSQAMARIRTIPRRSAAAVHEEAWRWLSSREGYLIDGEEFVRKTIVPARGAATLGSADSPARTIATRLDGVPPETIGKVLLDEHPQVVALVIAHLLPRQAAEVLVRLPEDLQTDVVHRIAEL